MRNYKRYFLTMFLCGVMLFNACGKETEKEPNNSTVTDSVTDNNSNIDDDKDVNKETDKESNNDEGTDTDKEPESTKEPDKPVEVKVIDGFYNCVEKENHFVRVDFEIKQRDDSILALFYSQYTPVNEYDSSELLYGEKVGDNEYEFKGEEYNYKVSWDGNETLIINGGDFSGTYQRGVKDGYGEGEYMESVIPSYKADDNVEKGIELDSTLAKAIRAELGLSSDHTLTLEDLESVTSISAWDYEIVSIKGISYLINLEELNLSTNYVTDISEMAQLPNIRMINICNGYIMEIPDFSKCDKLDALYLGGNMIEDLTPICNIPNLTWLDVNNNFITSIASLKEAKSLKTLCIYNNCILDYSEIQDCENLIKAYDENAQCTYADALALENRAKEIVETFPKNLPELELEKTIYNYIKDNMVFDSPSRNTNAFGYYGIMEGSGVCGDYAQAFALLANHAGLKAYECSSDTHAWNIVKIDGTYYHCDALWDEDVEKWIHFNKSSSYMMSLPDHTHNLLRYPKCEVSMSELEYCDIE